MYFTQSFALALMASGMVLAVLHSFRPHIVNKELEGDIQLRIGLKNPVRPYDSAQDMRDAVSDMPKHDMERGLSWLYRSATNQTLEPAYLSSLADLMQWPIALILSHENCPSPEGQSHDCSIKQLVNNCKGPKGDGIPSVLDDNVNGGFWVIPLRELFVHYITNSYYRRQGQSDLNTIDLGDLVSYYLSDLSKASLLGFPTSIEWASGR